MTLEKSDFHKIDLLLKYILAVAGQEDWESRELGPIHLIKYLYLADLAYAERKDGETFTGLTWTFHHFGPWSVEAYKRIEPVITEIGAKEKTISHPRYEEDIIRWSVQDDQLYADLESQLPLVIVASIKQAVHQFGSDTESLLQYVYTTWPMLTAAPEETLDFRPPDHIKTKYEQAPSPLPSKASSDDKAKRKEALRSIRERLKAKVKSKEGRRILRSTPPRYDEVFFEGVKWLDSLAGKPIEPVKGTARFSSDIWKSKARFDPDIS